jgi:hypothetical protein
LIVSRRTAVRTGGQDAEMGDHLPVISLIAGALGFSGVARGARTWR